MLSSTFVDELGYLPIDKAGADLLFQVISQRYEQGSILLTTNQPLQALAQDLQQRQHADPRRVGPPPAPRRNRDP